MSYFNFPHSAFTLSCWSTSSGKKCFPINSTSRRLYDLTSPAEGINKGSNMDSAVTTGMDSLNWSSIFFIRASVYFTNRLFISSTTLSGTSKSRRSASFSFSVADLNSSIGLWDLCISFKAAFAESTHGFIRLKLTTDLWKALETSESMGRTERRMYIVLRDLAVFMCRSRPADVAHFPSSLRRVCMIAG